MEQESLWIESFDDAVVALAHRVGGKKKLACLLRPNKDPSEAASWLADCLNADRPHKFETDDYRKLFRIGRENGCHVLLFYFTDDAGYSRPTPIEPEEERANLQRECVLLVERLERAVERMKEIEPSAKKGSGK